MTAPLSPQEAATVARFDAAEPAPESLLNRVADAMHAAVCDCGTGGTNIDRRMADAAIAVLRGDS